MKPESYTSLLLSAVLIFFCLPSFSQFGEIQSIAPGIDNLGLQTADLDNDGFPDIIGNSHSFHRIVWSKNEGNGTLLPPQLVSARRDASFINVSDINQDGWMDILCFYDNEQEIVWYTNQGNGQFSGEKIALILPGDEIEVLKTVDIDGDGDLDIIFSSETSLGISWLRNEGDYFSEPIIIDADEIAHDFILVDLDNDQDLDLAMIEVFGWNEIIAIYENTNGAGLFGPKEVIFDDQDNVNDFLDLISFDVNSDGYNDLVVSEQQELEVSWIQNLGNLEFDDPQLIDATCDVVKYLNHYDVDGDLDQDLIYGCVNTGNIEIHINTDGLGTFELYNSIPVISNHPATHLTDMDLDGDFDILSSLNGGVAIWHENLDGLGMEFESRLLISGILSSTSGRTLIGDLNGDQKIDILTNSRMGAVWYEKLDVGVTFDQLEQISTTLEVADLADIDGDLDLDILGLDTTLGSNSPRLVWLANSGSGTFGDPTLIAQTEIYSASLFDLNLDGHLDVLFSSLSLGGLYYCINQGNGNSFSSPNLITNSDFGVGSDLIIKDINGDNFPDILTFPEGGGDVIWYENNDGSGSFSAAMPMVTFSEEIQWLKIIDADEDGDLDIFGGVIGEVLLFENLDGFGNFGPQELFFSGANAFYNQPFQLADLDNDGDQDLLYTAGGNNLVWKERLSNDQFFSPQTISSNYSGNIELVDLNQDGDLDLFVIADLYLAVIENFADKPQIYGRVFWDQNENQIFDSLEIGINHQLISLNPANENQVSLQDGRFRFYIDVGDYELSYTPPNGLLLTTDSSASILVEDSVEIEHNFGVIFNPQFDFNPEVDLTLAGTQCGFQLPAWLTYTNNGPANLSGFTELILDPLVEFQNSYPAPDSISGLKLYWFFEDLPPSHSNQIKIILLMPDFNFEGEFISMQSGVFFQDIDGNILFFDRSELESEITCSYDPNDKLVEPNLPGFDNYTLFGDTLEYTIRFQNVGSDTAVTIRLEDQLDGNLDLSTFEVISYSHPATVSFTDNGFLTVHFNNIQLPPSIHNEVESHGFFKYRIVPLENLTEGTTIYNDAGIFFDFNPPIITNTVTNILVEQYPYNTQIIDPSCFGGSDGYINIDFPLFEVNYLWDDGSGSPMLDGLNAGEYQLQILDLDGIVVIDTTYELHQPDSLFLNNQILEHISCFDDSDGLIQVQINGGTPPYDYDWSVNNTNGPINDNLPSGPIDLTITDDQNCILELDFNLPQPPEFTTNTSATPETNQLMNGTATVEVDGGTPPYSFEWNTLPAQLDSIATNLSFGWYQVDILDANNCMTMDSVYVDLFVGTTQAPNINSFDVYPNMVDVGDEINILISLTKPTPWRLEILDETGKSIQVIDSKYEPRKEFPIQTEKWRSGTYFVRLQTDLESQTKKIILLK